MPRLIQRLHGVCPLHFVFCLRHSIQALLTRRLPYARSWETRGIGILEPGVDGSDGVKGSTGSVVVLADGSARCSDMAGSEGSGNETRRKTALLPAGRGRLFDRMTRRTWGDDEAGRIEEQETVVPVEEGATHLSSSRSVDGGRLAVDRGAQVKNGRPKLVLSRPGLSPDWWHRLPCWALHSLTRSAVRLWLAGLLFPGRPRPSLGDPPARTSRLVRFLEASFSILC